MKLLNTLMILLGSGIIAASILFIGRWEISAIGYAYTGGDNNTDNSEEVEIVYRLDRWTGHIEPCSVDRVSSDGVPVISCPFRPVHQ